MKKFSKILSVALLVALVLSLGVANAFAEETTTTPSTITVKNVITSTSIEGREFKAYKIFDAVYGDGDAVSYTIKSDSYYYKTAAVKAILDEYFTFTASASDRTVFVVAAKDNLTAESVRTLADALDDAIPSTDNGKANGGSNQQAVISVPGPGYYLVTGSVKSKVDADRTAETAIALVAVKDAAEVNAKGDIPDLKKEITAVKEAGTAINGALLDDAGKAAVAKVGSVVEYKLTSKVPDLTGYSAYTYTFTDTMSTGLTFNEDVAVYVGGSTTALANDKVAYNKVGNGFTLTIPYDTLKELATGATVEVKYSATVNESALQYDYEKNTAKLTYSDNPGDDSTHDTPDQETYVIDINVDVNKYTGTDPATGTKLANAEFKLFKGTERSGNVFYKWDATAGEGKGKVTWVAEADADVFKTGDNGKLTTQIRGLDKGTYSLLEVTAPSGYNLLPAPVEFTISVVESQDHKTVTYSSNPGTVTMGEKQSGVINLGADHETQPVDTIDVLNQSGTQLPSTGGIGTTIFYVVGGVLVLAAIILLVTKKRMSE